MATAIFYASNTGNTEEIAKEISKELGNVKLVDISEDRITLINEYDKIILGFSTWGDGELQDNWSDVWEDLKELNFSDKTVALFGLGDQENYGYTYIDAVGIAYEQLKDSGANIIGSWDISDEYFHDESRAIIDNKFVGLALDEDNQANLTTQRILKWCEDIKIYIL